MRTGRARLERIRAQVGLLGGTNAPGIVISSELLESALQETSNSVHPKQKEDGSYDPFDISEAKAEQARNAEITQSRNQLLEQLFSISPGKRDPVVIERICASVTEQLTLRDMSYDVGRFSQQFSQKRPLAPEAVWRGHTLHVVAPESMPTGSGHQLKDKNLIHKLIPSTVMACGAVLTNSSLRASRLGEWQSEFESRCEGCSSDAPSSLNVSWVGPPDQDELVAESKRRLESWLRSRLQAAKRLPPTEGERRWSNDKKVSSAPNWGRLCSVAQDGCDMAAILAVYDWVLAAGDDCLYLPLGQKQWTELRSRLPEETHRMVDVPTQKQLLQAVARSHGEILPGDPVSLPRLVEVSVDCATTIYSRPGINPVIDAMGNEHERIDALFNDKRKTDYPTILELIDEELGIKSLATDAL